MPLIPVLIIFGGGGLAWLILREADDAANAGAELLKWAAVAGVIAMAGRAADVW